MERKTSPKQMRRAGGEGRRGHERTIQKLRFMGFLPLFLLRRKPFFRFIYLYVAEHGTCIFNRLISELQEPDAK